MQSFELSIFYHFLLYSKKEYDTPFFHQDFVQNCLRGIQVIVYQNWTCILKLDLFVSQFKVHETKVVGKNPAEIDVTVSVELLTHKSVWLIQRGRHHDYQNLKTFKKCTIWTIILHLGFLSWRWQKNYQFVNLLMVMIFHKRTSFIAVAPPSNNGTILFDMSDDCFLREWLVTLVKMQDALWESSRLNRSLFCLAVKSLTVINTLENL